MKLVDMKVTKAEIKKRREGMKPSAIDEPEYPYGLEINFDNAMVEKLPALATLTSGESIELMAKCHVRTITIDKIKGKPDKVRGSIQIEELGIEKTNDEEEGFSAGTESQATKRGK